MTKPTKWPVRPVKTQISLCIHPDWSVFTVCVMDSQGPMASSWEQWRLWSGWQMPMLIWVFAGRTGRFVCFVMLPLISLSCIGETHSIFHLCASHCICFCIISNILTLRCTFVKICFIYSEIVLFIIIHKIEYSDLLFSKLKIWWNIFLAFHLFLWSICLTLSWPDAWCDSKVSEK